MATTPKPKGAVTLPTPQQLQEWLNEAETVAEIVWPVMQSLLAYLKGKQVMQTACPCDPNAVTLDHVVEAQVAALSAVLALKHKEECCEESCR